MIRGQRTGVGLGARHTKGTAGLPTHSLGAKKEKIKLDTLLFKKTCATVINFTRGSYFKDQLFLTLLSWAAGLQGTR